MNTDLDVSKVLESPQLEQTIQVLCHSPAYYKLKRWVEAERENPLRAQRLAKGIGWIIFQKLAEGVVDGQT